MQTTLQSTSHPTSLPFMLLTSREAAKLLNISERTLWQFAADGALPAVRIGRSVRYDMADLRAFIERRKTSTADCKSHNEGVTYPTIDPVPASN